MERKKQKEKNVALLRHEDRVAFKSYAELLQCWIQTNQEAYVHYSNLTNGFARLAPKPFDERREIVRTVMERFQCDRMDRYLKAGHNLTPAELRLGAEELNAAWTALHDAVEKLQLLCTEMIEIQERLEPKGSSYSGEPYLFFFDGMLCMITLNEVFADQAALQRKTIQQLGFDSAQEILPRQAMYWDIFRSIKQSMQREVLQWLE